MYKVCSFELAMIINLINTMLWLFFKFDKYSLVLSELHFKDSNNKNFARQEENIQILKD